MSLGLYKWGNRGTPKSLGTAFLEALKYGWCWNIEQDQFQHLYCMDGVEVLLVFPIAVPNYL